MQHFSVLILTSRASVKLRPGVELSDSASGTYPVLKRGMSQQSSLKGLISNSPVSISPGKLPNPPKNPFRGWGVCSRGGIRTLLSGRKVAIATCDDAGVVSF